MKTTKPKKIFFSLILITLCSTLIIQLIIQNDMNKIIKYKEKQQITDTITIAKKQLINKYLNN